jgi:hypothetical protein
MLVKQHAVELAQHGITVNGIAPTVVLTEAAKKWQSDPGRWEALLARIPLGRVGEPRDIAAAALYFCAPASDFVTGQVLTGRRHHRDPVALREKWTIRRHSNPSCRERSPSDRGEGAFLRRWLVPRSQRGQPKRGTRMILMATALTAATTVGIGAAVSTTPSLMSPDDYVALKRAITTGPPTCSCLRLDSRPRQPHLPYENVASEQVMLAEWKRATRARSARAKPSWHACLALRRRASW